MRRRRQRSQRGDMRQTAVASLLVHVSPARDARPQGAGHAVVQEAPQFAAAGLAHRYEVNARVLHVRHIVAIVDGYRYGDGYGDSDSDGDDNKEGKRNDEYLPLSNVCFLFGHLNDGCQFVKNGMNLWMSNWKRNGFKNSTGAVVKNLDIWIAMDACREALTLKGVKVSFEWVKGHSKIPGNEAADRLAVDGMKRI